MVEVQKRVRISRQRVQMRAEVLLDFTCILWLCNAPLRLVFSKLLSFIGLNSGSGLITAIIIFTPLLIYILIMRKLPWKYFHWIFLVCGLFFLLTYIIHPDYAEWYMRDSYGIMDTVFRPDRGAIWAFLMIEISETPKRIWKNIKYYAVIMGTYNIYLWCKAQMDGYWTFSNLNGIIARRSYSLDFGYDMMFILLVAFMYLLMYKKYKYIVVCFGAAFFIVRDGSRGAFLCFIVFCVLYLLNGNQSQLKKLIYSGGILCAGGIVYKYGLVLMQYFANFLIGFNISSRTITKILNGNLLDDTGRNEIYEIVISAIKNHPFLGYGAYGDRQFVAPYYYWGYSHNIFLEMAVDFGVILGTIFLFWLIFKSLKNIFTIKDTTECSIFLIVFSMSTRLLVSDTFWGNRFFWMLLALLIMKKFEKNIKKVL